MSDLMQWRRAMMPAIEASTEYISDGLVLWLDGLNRGSASNQWVDLIDGRVVTFRGSYSNRENGVYFANSANAYGTFDSMIKIGKNVGTIEFVVTMAEVSYTGRPIISMGNSMMGASYSSQSKAVRWYCEDTNYMGMWTADNLPGSPSRVTVSANKDRCLINGVSATYGTVTSWGTYETGYLASRGRGNPMYGTIHSIRLYDRLLSRNEMLHNQKVDNVKFNIGLTL